KNYLRNPFYLGTNGEILLVRHWRPIGRKPLDKVDQLYCSVLFSKFPVYAVSSPLLRHTFGKSPESLVALIAPRFSLRTRFLLAVATKTSLHIVFGKLVTARCKERFSAIERRFSVVAGTAVVPLHIISGPDSPFIRFHREADINMADPAGECFTMDPMLEKNGIYPGFHGVDVQYDITVLLFKNFFLLDS